MDAATAVNSVLSLAPVPSLLGTLAIFKELWESINSGNASKAQLRALALSVAQLLQTLNEQYRSNPLLPKMQRRHLDGLFTLLQEILAFVKKHSKKGFLELLYTERDRRHAVDEYSSRMQGVVSAFQLSVLSVQDWQTKMDNASATDQQALVSRFDDLDANHGDMKDAINSNHHDVLSRIESLRRHVQHSPDDRRREQLAFQEDTTKSAIDENDLAHKPARNNSATRTAGDVNWRNEELSNAPQEDGLETPRPPSFDGDLLQSERRTPPLHRNPEPTSGTSTPFSHFGLLQPVLLDSTGTPVDTVQRPRPSSRRPVARASISAGQSATEDFSVWASPAPPITLTAKLMGPTHCCGMDRYGQLNCVSWSANGRLVATGSSKGTVIVQDSITGFCEVATIDVDGRKAITSVALSPSGTLLVSGSVDGSVRIFHVETNALLSSLALGVLERKRYTITSVTWLGEGTHVVSGDSYGRIQVSDRRTSLFTLSVDSSGDTSAISSITASQHRCIFAAGTAGGHFAVWEWVDQQDVFLLFEGRHNVDKVAAMGFSDDDARFVTCSEDSCALWNCSTGEKIRAFNIFGPELQAMTVRDTLPALPFSAVSVSGDGQLVAQAARGKLSIWNVEMGSKCGENENCWVANAGVERHHFTAASVAWAPDASRLIVATHGSQGMYRECLLPFDLEV